MYNKFKIVSITILIFLQFIFIGCNRPITKQPNIYLPDNPNIQYTGRIDFSDTKSPKLSGAGSYLTVVFKGTKCEAFLSDQESDGNYGFLTIIVDGKYNGRIKITEDKFRYTLVENLKDKLHTLMICKATESQNGFIEFNGLICEKLINDGISNKKKIEFIGNSITCGMGLDMKDIPCGTGEWYDQHNAYFSYAPLAARALDSEWLLSSVSGIGMVRNWNSPAPVMPDVYENLYLNTDTSKIWDYKEYEPDLISICLGQNDFSDGDGLYDRGELDSAQFVNAYIEFVKVVRERNPNAQITLLSSPMLSGERSVLLNNYLTAVESYFIGQEKDMKIHKFFFSRAYNNGCSGHPDKNEHKLIAAEVIPFYQKLMTF